MSETLIVLQSFIGKVKDGDEDRVFREGENIRANDPAVKKWPAMFGEPRYMHDKPVEQATAAPGEKRG